MSETIKSEYKNVGKQTFEIRIYYNLGGINYFTNRNETRGYYLSNNNFIKCIENCCRLFVTST